MLVRSRWQSVALIFAGNVLSCSLSLLLLCYCLCNLSLLLTVAAAVVAAAVVAAAVVAAAVVVVVVRHGGVCYSGSLVRDARCRVHAPFFGGAF